VRKLIDTQGERNVHIGAHVHSHGAFAFVRVLSYPALSEPRVD